MNLLIVLVLALVLATTAPTVEARGRMFKGKDVQPQQMPSLVRMDIGYSNKQSLCSGTIISDVWILTAAHCCLGDSGEPPYAMNIFMGSNKQDLEGDNQFIYPYLIVYPVTEDNVKVHENYNLTGIGDNDIAVVKTEQIIMNENTKIAKLPHSTSAPGSLVGCTGTVAGWGIINDNGSLPTYAQMDDYDIIKKDNCENYFEIKLLESQLCAHKENGRLCGGDSGGPMYVGDRVVGISSFTGSPECEVQTHMVFTKVDFFLDWIQEKTNILY